MTGKAAATYTYDPLDRLTQVVDGATTVQFAYNGDGVRQTKTVNGATTTYLQDLQAALPVVLSETAGGQINLYLYGNDLLAQVDPAGNPTYYHADGLGSTRALSNAAGQRTDAYGYDVFGATRSHAGGSAQSFTFTGEQSDGELGLTYLRARYYDLSVGRFITADRLSGSPVQTQSLNRYPYALNNPNRLVDRSGQKPRETFWNSASAAAKSALSYGNRALDIASTALQVTGRGATDLGQNLGAASGLVGAVAQGVELAEFAASSVPDDVYSAYRSYKHDAGREPTKAELQEYLQWGFDIEYKQIQFAQKYAEGVHLVGGNWIADIFFPLPKITTKENDEAFWRWYTTVYAPSSQAGNSQRYAGSGGKASSWGGPPSQGK